MLHERVEILLIQDELADVELALHALRENKLMKKIQVLGDGEAALDLLFVQKPFDFDQFRAKVRQVGLYWLAVKEVPAVRRLDEQPVSR
jgi:hypothetical protein